MLYGKWIKFNSTGNTSDVEIWDQADIEDGNTIYKKRVHSTANVKQLYLKGETKWL